MLGRDGGRALVLVELIVEPKDGKDDGSELGFRVRVPRGGLGARCCCSRGRVGM